MTAAWFFGDGGRGYFAYFLNRLQESLAVGIGRKAYFCC
jgi:hypothetical protein